MPAPRPPPLLTDDSTRVDRERGGTNRGFAGDDDGDHSEEV